MAHWVGTTEPLVKQPACAPPLLSGFPLLSVTHRSFWGLGLQICGLLSRVRNTSAFLFPLSLTDISWLSSGIIFFWKLSGSLPLPRYPTPTPSAPTRYHHTVMLLLVIMTNPRGQGLALLTAMGTRPDTGEDTGQACSETNGCLVFSGPAAAIAPYGCQVDSHALTELGTASALAPSTFVLQPRALAWADSCGLISRAITGLLIFTH